METTPKSEILELANRDDFHDFAITTSAGERYMITDPLGLALGKTELAYFYPGSDRSVRVAYSQIAKVEKLSSRGPTGKIHRGNP